MLTTNVYVEAMEITSASGLTKEETFNSILSHQSAIKKLPNYLINGEKASLATIPSKDSFNELLIQMVQKLLTNSHLNNFHHTFLAIGTSVGGMALAEQQYIQDYGSIKNIYLEEQSIHSIAHTLNKHFQFKDSITFSTACTSSSNALLFAKELLDAGAYEHVLVLGADSISLTTVNGFHALGVLSSEPAIPFDSKRTGMNVAEGMAVVLLGQNKSAIQLMGIGSSSDAYNITNPHPHGAGAKLSMQRALNEANIEASDIDYINAHGTGTIANDRAEAKAILELFGSSPFVGSTKSFTGHTLGACGVLELVITAMALEQYIIPQNLNLTNKEFNDLNLPTKNIQRNMQYALSNAFAFGGNNVSLVLKKIPHEN